MFWERCHTRCRRHVLDFNSSRRKPFCKHRRQIVVVIVYNNHFRRRWIKPLVQIVENIVRREHCSFGYIVGRLPRFIAGSTHKVTTPKSAEIELKKITKKERFEIWISRFAITLLLRRCAQLRLPARRVQWFWTPGRSKPDRAAVWRVATGATKRHDARWRAARVTLRDAHARRVRCVRPPTSQRSRGETESERIRGRQDQHQPRETNRSSHELEQFQDAILDDVLHPIRSNRNRMNQFIIFGKKQITNRIDKKHKNAEKTKKYN